MRKCACLTAPSMTAPRGYSMWKLLLATAFFLLYTLALATVFAQSLTVEGFGPTRQAALHDAFQRGVERTSGLLLDSTTYVNNQQVLRDQVYVRSDGYIRDYRVVSERMKGEQHWLTVAVDIDMSPNGALMSDLQKLKTVEVGLGDPRIGVMVVDERRQPLPAAVAKISHTLLNSGFTRVLDLNQVEDSRRQRLTGAMVASDTDIIASLGTTYGFDYLVYGVATTENANVRAFTTDAYSARCELALKLFRTDTGQLIAADSLNKSGVDIAPAMARKDAITTAAAAGAEEIAVKLLDFAARPAKSVTITVGGVRDEAQLHRLERALGHTQNMQAVFVRSFAYGTAIFDVTFAGSAQDLSPLLQQNYELQADVVRLSGSVIDLKTKGD